MDEDRPGQAGPGLELGEQPVDVVDVLGALHLGHHDDVEPVADLRDEGREVVEHPRAVEGVDAGPQLGRVAEVGRPGDGHEPLPRGDLAVGPDGVLEVAEQDVDGADHGGDLRRHLLVARVEEVDDPGGPRRAPRAGGPGRRRRAGRRSPWGCARGDASSDDDARCCDRVHGVTDTAGAPASERIPATPAGQRHRPVRRGRGQVGTDVGAAPGRPRLAVLARLGGGHGVRRVGARRADPAVAAGGRPARRPEQGHRRAAAHRARDGPRARAARRAVGDGRRGAQDGPPQRPRRRPRAVGARVHGPGDPALRRARRGARQLTRRPPGRPRLRRATPRRPRGARGTGAADRVVGAATASPTRADLPDSLAA